MFDVGTAEREGCHWLYRLDVLETNKGDWFSLADVCTVRTAPGTVMFWSRSRSMSGKRI